MPFVHDAYSQRHLGEWFAAGCAPSDWDLEDLERFSKWVGDNADDLSPTGSWREIVAYYENTKDAVR